MAICKEKSSNIDRGRNRGKRSYKRFFSRTHKRRVSDVDENKLV